MSRYKRYPKYKDSGIPWIGEIPEHWNVMKLKHLILTCQNGIWGDEPKGDGKDSLCIRVADFDRDSLKVIDTPNTYRSISPNRVDERLVSYGDILLEKSGGGENTLVGANVQYKGKLPAVCSNFVARIKVSRDVSPTWLNYAMAMLYKNKVNIRSIKQTTGIQNLDSSQYLSEYISTPPPH